MKLTITKSESGKYFVVEDLSLPGSPALGRGRTMKEAMGDWLINNQREMGIVFDPVGAAWQTELRRRRRDLAKR